MNVIITIIDSSFGEVDWVLPVLFSLREQRRDWTFVTLFMKESVYNRTRDNPFLFTRLSQISDVLLIGNKVDSIFDALASCGIKPDHVRVLLKDFSPDFVAPARREIAQRCPQACVVTFPHSNYPYSISGRYPLQQCGNPDEYSKHDLFLLCSEHDRPFWSAKVDNSKIRIVGYPRYDRDWITSLLSCPELLNSSEWKLAQRSSRTFFYVSRGPHKCYLSEGDYEYLLQAAVEESLSYRDSVLLIKPHPRQDMPKLLSSLAPFPKDRWLVSDLHLVQLAYLADVVISGWSSGIMDALAVYKPVIEFWRYGSSNPDWLIDELGNRTSTFRELGLARAADSREELRALLDAVVSGMGAQWIASQFLAFENVCRRYVDASSHAANLILEEEVRRR